MYLLFYHPGWVILAGAIVAGNYLLQRYNLTPVEESKEEEEPPTMEERYAKEVDKKMKTPNKDDPKWQELDKKARAHNAWLEEKDRKEAHLEELTNEVV